MPPHILMVRFSAIGDILLTTPLIRALRERLAPVGPGASGRLEGRAVHLPARPAGLLAKPGRQIVALAPGAAHSTKRWPVHHWVALAGRLMEQGNDVVPLGHHRCLQDLQPADALAALRKLPR